MEDLHLPILETVETPGEGAGSGATDTSRDGVPEGGATGFEGAGAELPAKGKGKVVDKLAKPFLLSEGLPPVPGKLVARILKGDFVDMAELLRDNLEAQRKGVLQEAEGSTGTTGPSRPRRDIPDLLSWVQCFGLYAAVMASKYPERVVHLLAYQTLIIRAARRCGGRGWLSYDTIFRQQMIGEWRGEAWGLLNPYLFSSTFMSMGGSRSNCPLCLESDHKEEDCALRRAKTSGSSRQAMPRESYPYPREGSSRQARVKPRSMACFAWNQGECSFQFCKFKHQCVRCGGGGGGDHRITSCRSMADQEKRPPRERDSKLPERT